MAYTNDTLQEALLLTGLTPRDFEIVLQNDFHYATFYLYLKNGRAGPKFLKRVEEIEKFLRSGVEQGWFPAFIKSAGPRKSYVLEKYTSWKSNTSSEVQTSHTT